MSRMVTLVCSDGKEVTVDQATIGQSSTIRNFMEGPFAGSSVELHNITSAILAKVIEYCKEHDKDGGVTKNLEAWDAKFVEVGQATLFDLIVAANYLNIKSLLDLTCQTVVDMNTIRIPPDAHREWLWTGLPPKLHGTGLREEPRELHGTGLREESSSGTQGLQ